MKKYLTLLAMCFIPLANSELLSAHCPMGCPGVAEDNDVIFTHIYALSNNPKTKFADWVAYEVNPINYGVSPGRNWKEDPLLTDDETMEPADYKNVSSIGGDRGHQVPLATFAGNRYWYEANYLSNITPQDADLNQGPWKALEDKTREIATYEHPLYVISGPIYNETMNALPNADEPHKVPSAYYKIIYDKSGSISFLMKQNSQRSDSFCSKTREISDITALVNYKLPSFQRSSTLYEKFGCERGSENH